MTTTGDTRRWHPWRALREEFDGVTLWWSSSLPTGIDGLTDGHSNIWLRHGLSQARRRCALTHELWHIRRGILPADGAEERICDELAARQLIPLPELISGFMWSLQSVDLAKHLWVDQRTLQVRLDTLDPGEVAELEEALEGAWWQT